MGKWYEIPDNDEWYRCTYNFDDCRMKIFKDSRTLECDMRQLEDGCWEFKVDEATHWEDMGDDVRVKAIYEQYLCDVFEEEVLSE